MILRTSKENREIIATLTRKLDLGTENHIARIAFGYSISRSKLNLSDVLNSSGKEYSKSVFFGENYDAYKGLVSIKYNLHQSDNDIQKYIKMHVDDGLKLIWTIFQRGKIKTIFDLISLDK